jgi:Icc-related predicted phosphoesterase
MWIAAISDIHANEIALQAVLADIETCDVDPTICAGDIIGYGPDPGVCLKLVRETADVVVIGNHGRLVETPEEYRHHPTAGPGLSHAAEQLSSAQKA